MNYLRELLQEKSSETVRLALRRFAADIEDFDGDDFLAFVRKHEVPGTPQEERAKFMAEVEGFVAAFDDRGADTALPSVGGRRGIASNARDFAP